MLYITCVHRGARKGLDRACRSVAIKNARAECVSQRGEQQVKRAGEAEEGHWRIKIGG